MKQTSDNNLEAELIIKCKAGDAAAFGSLINLYRKRLFTFLLRLCSDRMLAEDLFQNTLIKVWYGFKNYNEQQKFSSWLFTIAHNVAVDELRRMKKQYAVSSYNNNEAITSGHTPFTELTVMEMQNALDTEVMKLPENQKQVFLLRMHSEMSFKEIAKIMNQPLNTVLGHMHYAVKKLRDKLREEHG